MIVNKQDWSEWSSSFASLLSEQPRKGMVVPTVPLSTAIAPPPATNSSSLLARIAAAPFLPAPVISKPMWVYVTRRFDQLIDNIGISADEANDGMRKAMRVVGSLNRAYYGHSSETINGFLLGSWAKQTRVRPFSDLDLLFLLPWSEYERFQSHVANKQSNLLQAVRQNLRVTYPRTETWADRHVVSVEVDGTLIEVVPAFLLQNGQIWLCDTKDGGRYKTADPAAEEHALQAAMTLNENARQLTRLLKKWQIQNDVALKSFQLERIAIEFMDCWAYRQHGSFWYDWMLRDCFLYLIGRANGVVQMPGTGEWIGLGSAWLSATLRAYSSASAACVHEQNNLELAAGRSWQEIFGTAAPVEV